jgi:hypothetical protein
MVSFAVLIAIGALLASFSANFMLSSNRVEEE